MAGHSKFANIKHRKGAQDKKRAKIFARLAKEITVAAKLGLPDPDSNPRLRTAILAARAQNMPKDNIERAIKKSSDDGDTNYEEIRYEGFGPDGIGIIVETLTDNRNRTASEVRSTFSKHGGNLGETGSVAFMFDQLGAIEFDNEVDADALFEAALEAGADDVEQHEEGHIVYCDMAELHQVIKGLEEQGLNPAGGSIVWRPQNQIAVSDAAAPTLEKLFDALDEIDDIQNVYHSAE